MSGDVWHVSTFGLPDIRDEKGLLVVMAHNFADAQQIVREHNAYVALLRLLNGMKRARYCSGGAAVSEPSKLVIAGKAYHVNAGTVETLVTQQQVLLDALRVIAKQSARTAGIFPNAPGRGDWLAVEQLARAAIAKAEVL